MPDTVSLADSNSFFTKVNASYQGAVQHEKEIFADLMQLAQFRSAREEELVGLLTSFRDANPGAWHDFCRRVHADAVCPPCNILSGRQLLVLSETFAEKRIPEVTT